MYKILWALNWNMNVVYVDNPRHNVRHTMKNEGKSERNGWIVRESKNENERRKRALWKEFVLWFSTNSKSKLIN